MCLVALLGLILPRVTLALLWFLTDWTAPLRPWWLGLLGFFLLPFTTLAYVLVHHWSGSVEVTVVNVVIFLIALVMDTGSWKGARSRKPKRD